MKWFVLRRVSVLLGVFVFGYLLTKTGTSYADLIGIADGIQFFAASVVFIMSWRSAGRIFTEYAFKASRMQSLAISFWTASFMLAAVWAVRWRASDYGSDFGNDALRFAFRGLAVCGTICALAAPEFFEQKISSGRLRKLGIGFLCVVATALLLVYGDRISRAVLHDRAPIIEQEGRPNG